MKKLLLTFGLLLACVFSFSQIIQPKTTPNFQQFGSPQTWTQTNGISYPVLGLVNSEYADTVSANLIPYVKNAPGVQIRIGDNIWLRSYDAKKWLLIPTQGRVVNGDTIDYLVYVYRPPGQLNVYGKFFNGVNTYERLMYTDSIGSGSGGSYTFTAPLNESGGVVDLGGLSGYGTVGQTIRTTGSAFQYSDKLIITSGGNVHIKDTMKVNALSPLPIDESDFEIAVFPDLQNMIRFATAHSRTMFQWLKDSIASANVKAMLQVGDITDWNTQTEYDTLLAQLNLVTSTHPDFPYLFIPGNHDYAGGFSPSGRDSTNYNANLGIAHYSGKPFYGGHYGVSNENFFITFEAGSRKYLALGLEFFPRDVVVDWASNILDSVYAADPAREVMVVTHSYIDQRGERAVDSSTASTTVYGMTADNSGQELWDKLIRKKSNIRWVFSGHHIISGTKANRGLSKHIVSVGDNGNMVNQIFVNYQDDVNWGNGYFMRLQFKPSQNIVDVKYYSSLYDAYDTRP
nr:metallophosphoesterase [Chitinophagaceae bacterium]